MLQGLLQARNPQGKLRGHASRILFVIDETTGIHPAVMTAIDNTVVGKYNQAVAVGNPESPIDVLSQFSDAS